MASEHCGGPCFVPPHPELLARTKVRALQPGGNNVNKPLLHDRRIPGMNDGTIFPSSHYARPTSVMARSTAALERTPLRGIIRIIVVLAEFRDYKFASGAKERITDLWFSTDRTVSTGSVAEYYSEVSNGAVSLTGEVVGPLQLPQKLSYYANNQYGGGYSQPNSQTMANDAFEAGIGITDFNQFDNDDNGFVDCFVVVHPGKDAAESGNPQDIWSVKWTLPEARELDGAKVYGFITIPEDAKCGVCAHELGHLLFGWPDFYDIDHKSSGAGNWCLMSFGCWGSNGDRPVHPSAWCKASQGWIETVTETENHEITLEDIKTSHKAHRLWTNGDSTGKEYFLIENRQLSGFDEYLPGTGLLVWHIDDAVWSNTDELHPRVKLIQADGLGEFKGNWGRGDNGDTFPGYYAKTAFSATSTPNSKAYSGRDTFVSITNIPASSPSMRLNITVRSSGPLASSGFDPKMWYRLKNSYQPMTHCLDVINDNHYDSKGLLNMARDGNYSGQHWQIVPNGDGTYFLRTLFLGPNRRLDINAQDKSTPILQSSAPVMGQYWRILPWDDGTWHLENAYWGPHRYLDLVDGGIKATMKHADASRPTQRWTITPMEEIRQEDYLEEALTVESLSME